MFLYEPNLSAVASKLPVTCTVFLRAVMMQAIMQLAFELQEELPGRVLAAILDDRARFGTSWFGSPKT